MDFYKNLTPVKQPVPEVLVNEHFFVDLPESWHVVVADIANSTEAVAAGRHGDVNLIAAGSLIVALNISKALKVEIPYFFGGDGGTVLVPGEIVEKVIAGLNAHRLNSYKNFSLDLRIGSISIKQIRDAGYEIKMAKVQISPGFNKSILIGDGLKYAEKIIKRNYYDDETRLKKQPGDPDLGQLNLEGMECKWDKIKPPATEQEVVCLLIESVEAKNQLVIYSEVLNKLEEIYGGIEKRHPLTINMLKLMNSFDKIRREMMARYGKWKPVYMIRTLLETFIGKFYFGWNFKYHGLRGKDYLSQLIEFSEILTIDGRINTIIKGTKENRLQLLEWLEQQEQKGLLLFGHYVSSASIMTCYVENLNNKHTHFIDGADGGYTEAAKQLKPKFLSPSKI